MDNARDCRNYRFDTEGVSVRSLHEDMADCRRHKTIF